MKFITVTMLILCLASLRSNAQNNPDAIIGRWASTEGNLIVEIYKEGFTYQGKLIWFDNSDKKDIPLNERLDEKNPNQAYRTRKLQGLKVLEDLSYNQKDKRYEHGIIYDGNSGKTWNASVWFENNNFLKVRGFWHFECLGHSLSLKKI